MSAHQGSTRLTVAQALVRFLTVQTTERDGRSERLIAGTLGIFGHGNVNGLGNALAESDGSMPYYQGRDEQTMVHTAIGFARARRRRSTLACAASIGPGSTNMVTGAATASVNRLPVLLLPADTYAARRQGNVLQQIEHPVDADVSVNDCFRPVSRFFDRISRPEQLLSALPEAMRVLTDPVETGAVTISLPQDVQTEAFDFPLRLFEPRAWRIRRPLPDPAVVSQITALLAEAKRPAIIAGGGIHYSEAWDALLEFASTVGAPVAETFAGKGALLTASDLGLGGVGVEGNPAANSVLREADLVVCVGTRLSDFITASRSLFAHPGVRFVGINIASHDASKLGALDLVADAREALAALTMAARGAGLRPDREYIADICRRREEWLGELATHVAPAEGTMTQGQLIRVLQESAKRGDTVVAAAGSPVGDLLKQWDATDGRAAHLEFGYSCMGHEIPAAIGARLASGPDGEIVALIGDGTFLMSPSDIVSALQEGLKVTILVADNHGFQVIRRLQVARSGVSFGNEFRARDPKTRRLEGEYLALDLAGVAEALGARAWRVSDEAGLREALEAARSEPRACLVVAEVEKQRFLPGSGVWWDSPAPEVSANPRTRELRVEYENGRLDQRYLD